MTKNAKLGKERVKETGAFSDDNYFLSARSSTEPKEEAPPQPGRCLRARKKHMFADVRSFWPLGRREKKKREESSAGVVVAAKSRGYVGAYASAIVMSLSGWPTRCTMVGHPGLR
ncbi:hypothetical protein KM043_010990 [Ampulex compressa]|nr:hypothetical protein KM043_010990 [Ampulex compressa]